MAGNRWGWGRDRGANCGMGKDFHTEEVSFRRGLAGVWLTSGLENFKPTRLYPSPRCMRSTLARRFRMTLGNSAIAANGALGISSPTCATEGIERRTATSMPPAETLRAVANSRNSCSASVWLLTKTGMAKGNRGHRRRSTFGAASFTHTPSQYFNRTFQAS